MKRESIEVDDIFQRSSFALGGLHGSDQEGRADLLDIKPENVIDVSVTADVQEGMVQIETIYKYRRTVHYSKKRTPWVETQGGPTNSKAAGVG